MPAIPRVKMPGGPSGPEATARYPKITPGGGDYSDIMEKVAGLAAAQQDIRDTIEANELLAEHTVQSRKLQSDINQSDIGSERVVPEYQKQIETLNKSILDGAKSSRVREKLAEVLPGRSASRVNEMQNVSDQKFVSESLAGYERITQSNTRAYASAATDQEREQIKAQHLGSLDQLTARGVFSPEQAQKERGRFSRGVELFDIEREINNKPEMGIDAILHPEKILAKYPNVRIDDLDNIFAKSVQTQERQRTLLDRKIKDAREAVVSKIDEAVIRNKLTFDDLNALRDRGLVSPEDYRRNAQAIEKDIEQGGVDNPAVRGPLETKIRLNPWSVSNSELVGQLNAGQLSRKGVNDLLDLKEKWQKSQRDEAERTDSRLKGPLFSEGKAKIDQVIGKGLTISGVSVDDNTRRRWGAAMDEYLERTTKERDKSHQDIANEIIKRYQGPAKAAEITPFQYRDDKGPRGINAKKLIIDFQKEKDPAKKRKLGELIDQIREAKE